MAEIDGVIGIADRELRKFKPRQESNLSLFLMLATGVFAVYAVVAGAFGAELEQILGIHFEEYTAIRAGIVAGILFALTLASIIVSHVRRCPPPSFRVKDELRLYLLSESMLPDDVTMWKSYLRIGRAEFDRATSRLCIWFDIRSAKATEEKFMEVCNGAAFRYAQDVQIKRHIDKRGRIDGYDLNIWYRPEDDVFSRLFRRLKHE